MEHLQRVWHASREDLPFRTPSTVPLFWGLLINAPIVETRFPELACLYSTFHLENTWLLSRFCFDNIVVAVSGKIGTL